MTAFQVEDTLADHLERAMLRREVLDTLSHAGTSVKHVSLAIDIHREWGIRLRGVAGDTTQAVDDVSVCAFKTETGCILCSELLGVFPQL